MPFLSREFLRRVRDRTGEAAGRLFFAPACRTELEGSAPTYRVGKNPGFFIKKPAQSVFLAFFIHLPRRESFKVSFQFKNTFRYIQKYS